MLDMQQPRCARGFGVIPDRPVAAPGGWNGSHLHYRELGALFWYQPAKGQRESELNTPPAAPQTSLLLTGTANKLNQGIFCSPQRRWSTQVNGARGALLASSCQAAFLIKELL